MAADALPQREALVIVAPARLQTALQPFAEYKRASGPVEVVSLEAILAESAGIDDPEKVKRFLYTAWKHRDLHFVLLVGDADVLPVRYMVLDRITEPAYDYAFYPSDLYYADIAKQDGGFEDWNGQKESFHGGYFGEVRGEKNKRDPINYDEIDYHPELAVGRWPVNEAEEVERLVKKTIDFECRIDQAEAGVARAGLVAVGGWVDSRRKMDRVGDFLPDAWQLEKRYYSDRRREAATPPPTEQEVIELLNSGVDLLCHAGHGTDTSWEKCFSLKHLGDVTNRSHLPVIISAGCSTARFAALPPYEAYVDVSGVEHKGTDAGEVLVSPPVPPAVYQSGRFNRPGLGEQLLRQGPNGAVAYIGCNTGSQPCGLTLLEGFAKAWGESEQPYLGDCWIGAIDYFYETEHLSELKPTDGWYPPSIFFQGMKFMVFGDPSLRLPR